ncbi:unnamed protein product [Allacma fusca]|uniref:Vitelline membrane outer layer protein 1 n=1 Tax=Allacma fusca TaxID=39272 RepID=A0A8J2LRH7_9HEXA|nr:unnamed protein product [Allacma fusca]
MKSYKILSTLLLVVGLTQGDVVVLYKAYANLSEIGFDLESPQITDFGTWGEPTYCPPGEVVTGFQLKVEPKNSVDDTALNGVRFYCGTPGGSNEDRQNITSKVGHFGNWGRVFDCPTYAVGFELQSHEYQGPRGDDTAANNMKLHCAGGGAMEGFHDNGHTYVNSRYTDPQMCPTGKGICAIQTQVERYQLFGDDTSLNNIRVKCCDLLSAPEIPIAGIPIVGVTSTAAPVTST